MEMEFQLLVDGMCKGNTFNTKVSLQVVQDCE